MTRETFNFYLTCATLVVSTVNLVITVITLVKG